MVFISMFVLNSVTDRVEPTIIASVFFIVLTLASLVVDIGFSVSSILDRKIPSVDAEASNEVVLLF